MNILRRLKAYCIKRLRHALLPQVYRQLDTLTMLHAQAISQSRQQALARPDTGGGGGDSDHPMDIWIESTEFRAYSQNGEDGILDFLIDLLELDSQNSRYPRAFVEFGVQDYTESNTRYLLKKRNFQGLVMDGNASHIDYIRQDEISWKHDLEARCVFITRENINESIQAWLTSRELNNVAILSVDIDGMDYYVWESISCIEPAIVVVEYNAILGEDSLCVPHQTDFERFSAHHSGLYFGASLQAFITLAVRKGYIFVGCDSTGTNAFFIKQEFESKVRDIRTHPLSDYCTRHHARQSRDTHGRLSFLAGRARFEAIAHLAFVNPNTSKEIR